MEAHVDKQTVPDMATDTHINDDKQNQSGSIHKSEEAAVLNGHEKMVNLDESPLRNLPTHDSVTTSETRDTANDGQGNMTKTEDQVTSHSSVDDRGDKPNVSMAISSGDVTKDVSARDVEGKAHVSNTPTGATQNGVSSVDIESDLAMSGCKLPASDKDENNRKLNDSIETESSQYVADSDLVNPNLAEQTEPKDDEWILVLGHEKLKKKKLKSGEGISSRPQHGDIVTVSYSARLDSGEEVDKHDQHVFTLGDGDVIQALDLCVALMELHELCTVVTEAQYAYGGKGRDPDIPPNAKLTYTIELLNVEEAPDYSTWPINKRIEEGNKKKERGNELYSRGEYSFAINSYTKALAMLDDSHETTHDASAENLQLLLDTRLTCYNNLAAAQIKIEAWDAAIQSCDQVLKKQAENVKALFRKGKCLSNKGELEMAIAHLQKALKLDPGSKIIHQELVRLKAKNRNQNKSQAAMYQRMFWGGNKKPEKQTKDKWRWWWYVGGAISAAALSASLAAYRYLHT